MYVSSAATGGRSAGSSVFQARGRPASRLGLDDARDEPLQQNRLRVDGQTLAFDARQHEQVLDEPVQPVRL